MTYRELAILLEEEGEYIHDINEREAMFAIMYAAASRGKGKKGKLPKVSDLYNRDKISGSSSSEEGRDKVEELAEKNEHTRKWLEQFDLSQFNEKGEGSVEKRSAEGG